MRSAIALLRGGLWPLGLVAVSVLAQRLLLPFAVLHLEARTPATAALLGAAALGFVRTRAADRVARVVRMNVLELHLGPFVSGPTPALPSSEVVTAQLATELPLLVSWAVDGVALVVAAVVAVPAVVTILISALGLRVLVPIGAAALVGAAVTIAASRRVIAAWTVAWDRAQSLITAVAAGFDGAVDLRAHGRAEPYAGELRAKMGAWCEAEGGARFASTVSTWGGFAAALLAAAGVVALSNGALAPEGDPYRMSLLVLAAVPTLHTLVSGVGHILSARVALLATRKLAGGHTAMVAESHEPIDVAAEIRLEDVGYRYPARGEGAPPVVALEGIGLRLPARGSIAVTGPNGAGKTTLLHVLLGVVRPDRGHIFVGGSEARLDNPIFRASVAYLSQRPFEVSEGTIADNLRAFDGSLTDDALLGALETVGLLAVLRARATSDQGVLGLSYRSLSKGQARRAMLARALLRDASLLVLDEPEAHLDAASAVELSSILKQVAASRRVVAAVHDRSLVGFADAVIELAPPVARVP